MRGPVSGAKLPSMPWNSDLRSDVEEQLAWEPDIGANAIAVMVVDGHVTLRGTVGTASASSRSSTKSWSSTRLV